MFLQLRSTHSYRIRLSDDDLLLLKQLKLLNKKPTTFMRNALREKIKRDLPKLIDDENKRKYKIKCPF